MSFIRIKTGPNKGKIFEIKDQVLTIGRDESQTIQILDQGVSRAHAEIFRLGDMSFVRDLNSTNGTYVNNVKITEEALKATDELLIGTTILHFEETLSADPGFDDQFGSERGPETTTLSLKTDKGQKIIGRDVTSRNLTVTTEIGKILGSGHDLGPALKRALEVLTESIGADHGYIFMVDRATGKLSPRASVERGEEGSEKKVSRTIAKRVMTACAPILTTDATLDDRFMLSESIVLKKIKSVMAAPLVIGDKAEGLLYFHAAKVNATFKVEDLELVAAAALQVTLAIASQQTGDRIRRSMISTIRSLVTAMEIVDPKNQGHSERVADSATAIALHMKVPREDIHNIRLAALLHDVGKLAAHQTVSGGKNMMQEQHVLAGERILSGIEGHEQILPGIRYHHERADGSGFPHKIKNDQTPLMARIIIVANHFDNLCAHGGIGGQGIPATDVLKDIAQRGGTEFDDDVVKALLVCHRSGTLYSGAKLLEE